MTSHAATVFTSRVVTLLWQLVTKTFQKDQTPSAIAYTSKSFEWGSETSKLKGSIIRVIPSRYSCISLTLRLATNFWDFLTERFHSVWSWFFYSVDLFRISAFRKSKAAGLVFSAYGTLWTASFGYTAHLFNLASTKMFIFLTHSRLSYSSYNSCLYFRDIALLGSLRFSRRQYHCKVSRYC